MNINLLKILKIKVGTANVCIDIRYINRVLPLMAMEKLPLAPLYYVGLMNLSGKSIPVIDLGIRLNLPRTVCYPLDTPVLYCLFNNRSLGILVDKILGLENVLMENLQMSDKFKSHQADFLGTFAINSELWLLLNMEKLLDANLLSLDKLDTHLIMGDEPHE